MKVSVIIPVYNVAPYIERCLDSVCAQTYSDIECILVDDCGTDNSVEIAERYIEGHERAKRICSLVHHAENRGQSAARNTALAVAKGEYVYFLDSDDAIVPDCISLLVSLAQAHPDADFVQGNALAENGAISHYGFKCKVPQYSNRHDELESLVLAKLPSTAWNRLIRRSFITDNNLYFPEGLIHEDMIWTFFVAKSLKAASFTATGTYVYYLNGESTMTSVTRKMREKRIRARLSAAKSFYEDVLKDGKSSKAQRHFMAGNLISCMGELWRLASPKQWMAYWLLVCKTTLPHFRQLTCPRFLLLLAFLPPACFMIGVESWHWRLKKYVVSKI